MLRIWMWVALGALVACAKKHDEPIDKRVTPAADAAVTIEPIDAAALPTNTNAPSGYQCGVGGKPVPRSDCMCPPGMIPARDEDNIALCVVTRPDATGSGSAAPAVAPVKVGKDLRFVKVSGEGQVIPPNEWRNFIVKVVDGTGKPVAGVRVAWRTPALGPKTYIDTTRPDGSSSATQLYSGSGPAELKQVAALAPTWTGGAWSETPVATTTGVEFKFSQREVVATAPPSGNKLIKVSGDGQVIPLGGWKNFVVKVVDAAGQPVVGARVAWRTPALGPRSYIGKTAADGTTSATQLYTSSKPIELEQVAALAPAWTGAEWSDDPVPTTTRVTFKYSQGDGNATVAPAPCANFAGTWTRGDGFTLEFQQSGCTVSGRGTRDAPGWRHTIAATVKDRMFVGFIDRTDGDGCFTRLHVAFRMIDDTSFEHRTTATDGKCGLAATFTEQFVYRRR